MGTFTSRRIRKSIISFKGARGCAEEDLPDFSGTVSCSPCDDTPRETLSDWERLDYGDERDLGETG